MQKEDKLIIGGHEFHSRFILGSGKYSLKLIEAAVKDAGAEIITLAVRRANTKDQENILDFIPKNVTLLPNTSGARNAEEAVRIARLARELGCGDFVKIEIMRDSKYLLPDNYETIKATEILAKEGFVVMPYMYPDLNVARDLVNAGAASIMPLASPIGSNKGLATKEFIQILVDEISTLKLNLTEGSSFTGAVNPDGAEGDVDVTLSKDSTWTLTGDSYVSSFTGSTDNVIANGYHLYVDGEQVL